MPGGVPEGGFVALVFGKWRSAQGHPAPDYAFGQDDEEAVAPPQPVEVGRYPWRMGGAGGERADTEASAGPRDATDPTDAASAAPFPCAGQRSKFASTRNLDVH